MHTIYDTSFAKMIDFKRQADSAAAFIVVNQSSCCLSDREVKSITNAQFLMQNPVIQLYRRIVDSGLINQFLFLDFSQVKNVPERVADTQLVIDGRILETTKNQITQKIWINITPLIYKRDPAQEIVSISDIPRLASQVVLGWLCATYDVSKFWLENRDLATLIIDSYSMMIAAIIRRMKALDPMETKWVQTVFAMLYAQRIDKEGSMQAPALLRQSNLHSSLGDWSEINAVLEAVNAVPGIFKSEHDMLTMASIVEIFAKAEGAPPALKDITLQKLLTMFIANTADSQIMSMMLECPPFWVFQLIRMASKTSSFKNYILESVFKQTMLPRVAANLVTSLVQSPNFLRI